jgi:hypothetical protein
MKKLADLKVGDEVWTIQSGFAPITEINYKNPFGIDVGGYSYQMNGKYFDSDIFSSLYLENPFEHKIKPKEMMCEWQGTYKKVECIVSSDGRVFVQSGYSNAKEIEPEEALQLAIVEISIIQIAEKFGVDVEQIRIKP